jgi:hypothetical protein
MFVHQRVRTLARAGLLALAIFGVSMGFAQARPQPEELGTSTAEAPAVYAQAPVVRDHRQRTATPIVRDHRQPTPARGNQQADPEASARLQLVIRKIIVHDDRDLGSGDISINVVVTSRETACRGGCITRLVESTLPEFQADSGGERRVDRVVPAAGDFMGDAAISPDFGIPIYPDREYAFAIRGVDKDSVIVSVQLPL